MLRRERRQLRSRACWTADTRQQLLRVAPARAAARQGSYDLSRPCYPTRVLGWQLLAPATLPGSGMRSSCCPFQTPGHGQRCSPPQNIPLPPTTPSLIPPQAGPPDASKIPEDDLLGATVVMVTCGYKGQEFIRVGYWINNTYGEALPEGAWQVAGLAADRVKARHQPGWRPRQRAGRGRVSRAASPARVRTCLVAAAAAAPAGVEPPKPCPPEKVIRSILADKPRVTRFNIEDWS